MFLISLPSILDSVCLSSSCGKSLQCSLAHLASYLSYSYTPIMLDANTKPHKTLFYTQTTPATGIPAKLAKPDLQHMHWVLGFG